MTEKTLYITTTLPYVNDDPHIGHALEYVQADVLARMARMSGHRVFFNTGTDEHGLKIFEKAHEAGKTPQEYVDFYAGRFKSLIDLFSLTYDGFVRTTDESHKRAAQELWRRCEARGDIYKKNFKGLYCVSDEMYIKEGDLVNGRCPNHQSKDLIEMEEENYFFRLSAYQDVLQSNIVTGIHTVVPEIRKNELSAFIERGLEDISISRRKESLPWGIPVPTDDEHVMYVWFDALTNYISTLGWPSEEGNYNTFWKDGETLQLAGKDQLRFQSVLWQAMLLSAGLPPTDQILYHGFITSQGEKMSKSIGNVISPFEVVDLYGADALRYFLLRHVHPFQDSDVTMEHMKDFYNANLANGIGNLLSRIVTMANKYEVEVVFPKPEHVWHDPEWDALKDMFSAYEFHHALDHLWIELGALDQFIAETEPYKLIKTDPDKAKECVAYVMLRLFDIAVMLEPCMPATSTHIRGALATGVLTAPLFARKE